MVKPSCIPPTRSKRRVKASAKPEGISKSRVGRNVRGGERALHAAARETLHRDVLPSTYQPRITRASKRNRDCLDEVSFSQRGNKRQKQASDSDAEGHLNHNAVEHWVVKDNWPQPLFQPHPMAHMLARKKSTTSLSRKRSIDGQTTSRTSEEKTGEEKSAPYQDGMYEEQLRLKGCHMEKHKAGPHNDSIASCRRLLMKRCKLPQDSRFSDNLLSDTFEGLRNQNESRIIRDISELIVPSPHYLYSRGEIGIGCLVESVNEGWTCTDPIAPVRPQPDFSVGFARHAFTEELLDKIRPLLGDSRSQVSQLRATTTMYFPFVSQEVKRCGGPLVVADRQNMHSMCIGVRSVVNIFKLACREQELNGKILAFSVSHDDRYVRIYGYYPSIAESGRTTYHRHEIQDLNIQSSDAKDRWTSYQFFRAVYDIWAPQHLQQIRSVLQDLPQDIDQVISPSESTGPPQQFGDSHISGGSLLDQLEHHETTPESSVSVPRGKRDRSRPVPEESGPRLARV